MRKTITKALALMCSLIGYTGIQSQDYQISFAGTGDATTVESIEVQNLTQGTTKTLNQGEILHLINTATALNEITDNNQKLVIYPNPMVEKGKFEFTVPTKGDCEIALYDIIGKKVVSKKLSLPKGTQLFEVSGLASGVYNLSIKSASYKNSGKLISKNSASSNATISYMGSNSVSTKQANATSSYLKSAAAGKLVEMHYADGDRLLITATSGAYKSVKSLVPTASATETFELVACSDGNNNNYKTVKIGTQTWMAENLRATKYNTGTNIPLVTDNTEWYKLNSPGYCWYDNDKTYAITKGYGALYNWHTVQTCKLCPTGWHVPTDEEWTSLENYLISNGYNWYETTTDNEVGKSLASASGWSTSNNEGDIGNDPGSNNKTGFSALPGGHRFNSYNYGKFYSVKEDMGRWWSSTQYNTKYAYYRSLLSGDARILRNYRGGVSYGYSVRCVKD